MKEFFNSLLIFLYIIGYNILCIPHALPFLTPIHKSGEVATPSPPTPRIDTQVITEAESSCRAVMQ